MRLYIVLRYIGLILALNAIFMLLSAGVSLLNGMDSAFYPLLQSFVLTAILGLFPLIFVPKSQQISNTEGYGIVVGSWLMACLVGMLPYDLWGGEFTLINAWFESVSGFTTTGSTILNDVEALPKGLLFWRASTHWLGGVGVVMFVLLVLPSMGSTKMRLSNVELSSMAKDNFRYQTKKILQILLVVYVGLTAAETLLLKIAGMGWFDAVCNSFSTIATGGFCTKNASIAAYNSASIEIIIMFFMMISGLHFGLIFGTLTGKNNNIFRSEISRYYALSILIGGCVIAADLWINGYYPNFWTSLRYGLFETISVSSTTGFATADTSIWSPLAIILLMLFTFQCGCAGSTAGGIKCDRMLLSFKAIKAMMIQRQHPNAIIRVKMNGVIQENHTVNMAVLFIIVYLLLVGAGTVIFSAFNIDLETSFSMTIASMANAGSGFGEVGSMDNYHNVPALAKWLCTVFMLLGRLEIFGFLQLFLINRWK